MFNTQVVELKEELAYAINKSKLPSIVKMMAIKEMITQLNTIVAQELQQEKLLTEKEGEKDAEEICEA